LAIIDLSHVLKISELGLHSTRKKYFSYAENPQDNPN